MRALDELLPEYDVHEVHAVEVPLPPEEALRLALDVPFGSDSIVRALLRLRGIRPAGSLEEGFRKMGFEVLARTPTELVVGGCGRPWHPRLGVLRFGEARPGHVRMAADFRVEPSSGAARLSSETRVVAVDDAALRAFRRYWRLVGPFSALIRRRWLAAVRKRCG